MLGSFNQMAISKLKASSNSPIGRVTACFWSWAPAALAAVLLILVFLKAIMAVDTVWDSLAYHLAFSAERVGLIPSWQIQRPPPNGYYLGLPILADLVRGWLWKLTGRPEAVNLLSVICLLLLAAYLKWAFRQIEVAWVLIGLLAIPAVQTAASGNYVDVSTNAIFTIFLLSIVDLWTRPMNFMQPARWIVLFASAAAAANFKPQAGILAFLAFPAVIPPGLRLFREWGTAFWRQSVAAAVWLSVWLLIGANLIKNLVLYQNPFFPVDITVAGIHFVGPLTRNDWDMPGRAFGELPRVLQWVISVLEFHSLDGRDIPYSNGMGFVPVLSPAAYMGGFFSALVVGSICFLVLCVYKRRDRLSIVVIIVFLISSAIISALPQSFNLRYVMFWMMYLIIACLLLLRDPSLRPYLQCYKIILFASLVFVSAVTGGVYFTPIWNSTQEYVDKFGVEKLLEPVLKAGDIICLEQGPNEWDSRFTILFAPIFHQKLAKERPYAIREGDCAGFKTIHRGNFY